MTTSVHALRETHPNVPLVERLIAAGLISEHQLRHALREKNRRDRPMGEILVELGMISERTLGETLGQLLGEEQADLALLLPDSRAIDMLPRAIAEHHRVFPLAYDPKSELITLAVSETIDLAGVDVISRSLHPSVGIATVVAAESDIRSATDKFYDTALTIPEILKELDDGELDAADGIGDPDTYDHPINRLIDAIFFAALQRDAAVIHIEPEKGFIRVRLRVDGVLNQLMALHRCYWPGVEARLTALSGARPDTVSDSHDAQLSRTLGTRRTALTFSRYATLRGTSFVIAIDAVDEGIMSMEALGFDTDAVAKLCMMMSRPEGMIVVAGPPRSGKTTTINSMLGYRCDDSVSILMIENPPLREIPLVRQVSKIGEDQVGTAARFESLVHRDTDVLMVGELRDSSAAEFALHTAARGQQVFATITSVSALAALSSLRDFDLQPANIAANTVGVIAQRLLRRLCVACKQVYSPSPLECELLGSSEREVPRLFREGACVHCNYLGYKGRIPIAEILFVEEELADHLSRGATLQELQQAVTVAGLVDLCEQAVRQVLFGVTSLSEASRVVDLSARLRLPAGPAGKA